MRLVLAGGAVVASALFMCMACMGDWESARMTPTCAFEAFTQYTTLGNAQGLLVMRLLQIAAARGFLLFSLYESLSFPHRGSCFCCSKGRKSLPLTSLV